MSGLLEWLLHVPDVPVLSFAYARSCRLFVRGTITTDETAPPLYGDARAIYSARFFLERGGGLFCSPRRKRRPWSFFPHNLPPTLHSARLEVTVTVPASYPDLLPTYKLRLVKVSVVVCLAACSVARLWDACRVGALCSIVRPRFPLVISGPHAGCRKQHGGH